VDKVNELRVDLVLLAGDFFDNSRVDDDVVEATVVQLGRLEMPTVLLPGNHDQLDEVSVYHRDGFKELPPNLYLLRSPEGETVLFPDMKVSVWGRPTFDHEVNFRPLQGTPPRNGPWWHVGIAHGFYVPPGVVNDRSSPIFAYEIEATGYDYIALGHSDLFTDLSQTTVRAAYSGAPIVNTDGSQLGSVALVRLHPEEGVSIQRVPLTDQAL
jgi:DNA repair exonuclease SbcCD nuclease subunit